MNKINQPQLPAVTAASAVEGEPMGTAKMPSRRRLIKLGTAAVPVIATLASRPALAWHCQSPSAWGSENMNPNTSLKTNVGHQSYQDETWYVSNWKGNSARNSTKPWDRFFVTHGNVTNPAKKWYLVTFAHLSALGYTVPVGFNASDKVKDKLTTSADFKTSVLVAQLNFKCTPTTWQNEMSSCVDFDDLKNMASQSAPYNTAYWSQENIRVYLFNNWLAR